MTGPEWIAALYVGISVSSIAAAAAWGIPVWRALCRREIMPHTAIAGMVTASFLWASALSSWWAVARHLRASGHAEWRWMVDDTVVHFWLAGSILLALAHLFMATRARFGWMATVGVAALTALVVTVPGPLLEIGEMVVGYLEPWVR